MTTIPGAVVAGPGPVRMRAMNAIFHNVKVSIAVLRGVKSPFDDAAFEEMVGAAAMQDHPGVEVLAVDGAGGKAPTTKGVRHLPGSYANRAAMLNAALAAAAGEYLLVVDSTAAPVVLKRSAVRTMIMAATRRERAGMVYADYERVSADGAVADVHLLDWHEGRLRDTTNFGLAILYAVDVLKDVGGFNENYAAADMYDLRLRVSEKTRPVHIANRYAGGLYRVREASGKHNVFDYLLASKDAQLEMEAALGAHLQRIGAHLAPGAHVQSVPTWSSADGCVASVVIPVNNRPEFIGRAIESVQAQTVKEVEAIVVVNGGADDPTVPAVKRYLEGGGQYQPDAPPVRLIVVDVNNLGLCLNAGIASARGKYYVQLDSDDRLKPDAVEKLLAVFEADPTVGMVVGSYEVWNLDDATGELSRDENVPVVTHDEWTADNGRNNLLRINGAGAPRCAHVGVIADAGWFGVNDTPSCRNYGEDYDLVLRISERYTIGRVWEPIYEVIRHAGGTDHSIDQTTVDRNDNAKDEMRREALHRRNALNSQ